MSENVMKVIAVSTEVPDQVGMAAGMAAVLRERHIGLKAVWSRSSDSGMTTVVSIPEKIEDLRALAAEEGRRIEEIPMVWMEGPDEAGALYPFLAKVGEAHINIHAMIALAVAGSFAGVFEFADEATVDRVVALLGG
jgi:hypothetical protein